MDNSMCPSCADPKKASPLRDAAATPGLLFQRGQRGSLVPVQITSD
jgi:hypothetical protein